MPFIRTVVCCLAAVLLAAPGFAHSTGGFHWEKLHVYNTTPSEVFAKLGLTHITRHGYTRGQKRDPDPSFPPGLTDVVPYDPGHTLLVRGTKTGVALFRERVLAADVPAPRWQAAFTLLRKDRDDDQYQTVAGENKEIVADTPLTVAFSSDGRYPECQVRVRVNRDGTLAVTCRAAHALTPQAAGASTGVLVPTQVWTVSVTKDMRLGDTLTFDDTPATRRTLGQAAQDVADDYQVQVQITPETAAPAPLTPMPGGPAE